MIELKARKVAVLGLHDDGQSMLAALLKAGALVTGFGTATLEQAQSIEAKLKGIKLIWNSIPKEGLLGFDLLIDTPGGGNFSQALSFAKEKGVQVLSDLDLALEFMQAPLIAVTGTNGKSTTVALIGEMLKAQGYKITLSGGDFSPWSERVLDKNKYDYHVLEVNSRRLEISSNLHPHIAVLLNLFPAHGDRHKGGVPAYFEAKAKIFMNQTEKDFLICDGNAKNVQELVKRKSGQSRMIPFSFGKEIIGSGVYTLGKKIIALGFSEREEAYSLLKSSSRAPTYLMDLMAALSVARLCKVENDKVQKVIDTFKPLTSRMEKVEVIGDVTFIDDSKSTNIGATAWALSSFIQPIIWIAGGKLVDGSQLRELPKLIKGKVRLVIVIGSEAKPLTNALQNFIPVLNVENLQQAVEIANKKAEPKDVVVYSPVCPPDYNIQGPGKARGIEFRSCISRLPKVPRVIRKLPHLSKI